jgi:hypothetical protein
MQQCDDAPRACQATDRVYDAKIVILCELERIRRRRAARRSVEDAIERTSARRAVASSDPVVKRAGIIAARDHLRRAGLHSETTDAVLRAEWTG